MAKNDNQPSFRQEFLAPTAPRERKPLLFMLISLLSGALAILASLFPVWIRATNNRVLAYNLIGVINQDVGSDAVREENVPLLLLYVSGAVLLAVGGVCVLNRLKTASFFLMGASLLLTVMGIRWMRVPLSENDVATEAFSNTPMPVIFLIFSITALIAALVAAGYFLLQSPQPVRQKNAK